MRTRIKICGLTREEDVQAAVQAGADAVGMVFYPPSKRCLDPEQAARLRESVPPLVDVVALFVNADASQVDRVVQALRPDWLQFHGDETPAQCAAHGRPFWRAFRVGAPGLDTADALAQTCESYADAGAWLFDSFSSGYGGSGLAFDHALLAGLPAARRNSVILSGGLNADNVTDAILRSRPWAVDVSSGVETALGIKSARKIDAFVRAVRQADDALSA